MKNVFKTQKKNAGVFSLIILFTPSWDRKRKISRLNRTAFLNLIFFSKQSLFLKKSVYILDQMLFTKQKFFH